MTASPQPATKKRKLEERPPLEVMEDGMFSVTVGELTRLKVKTRVRRPLKHFCRSKITSPFLRSSPLQCCKLSVAIDTLRY